MFTIDGMNMYFFCKLFRINVLTRLYFLKPWICHSYLYIRHNTYYLSILLVCVYSKKCYNTVYEDLNNLCLHILTINVSHTDSMCNICTKQLEGHVQKGFSLCFLNQDHFEPLLVSPTRQLVKVKYLNVKSFSY